MPVSLAPRAAADAAGAGVMSGIGDGAEPTSGAATGEALAGVAAAGALPVTVGSFAGAGAPIGAPQKPQNLKPGCTLLPQLAQSLSAVCAGLAGPTAIRKLVPQSRQ